MKISPKRTFILSCTLLYINLVEIVHLLQILPLWQLLSSTKSSILLPFSLFEFFTRVYNNIIIVYSLEFFTSALADGLSLEFEWQQVSSSLHDSTQYSGRSQQCCSLDGLHSSS